jgi:hypothetical protein
MFYVRNANEARSRGHLQVLSRLPSPLTSSLIDGIIWRCGISAVTMETKFGLAVFSLSSRLIARRL